MIITDNKKAHNFSTSKGLDVANLRKVNMSNLTQNFANPNNQPLVIGDFSIRQDQDGRYCLNDLHRAGGDLRKDRPTYFLENEKTQELITAIEAENYDVGNPTSCKKAVNVVRGRGKEQGTYAVKELVYSYAMWISAKFHLMVIRAYDSLAMEWVVGGKQTISPEQCGILYNIVHTRAGENKNLIMQMWSRLKNHFKYTASYRELRAVHFDDAKHYLEMMELKTKTTEVAVVEVKAKDDELKDSYFLHDFQAHEFDTRLHSLFDIANLFEKQAKELNKFLARSSKW